MILTLDSVGTYFERGTLIIDGDRIVSVNDGAVPVMDQPGDKAIDAADKIVMPGLVDLHYHTALGKGYNDHLPLWEYLDECWYPIVRARPRGCLLGGACELHRVHQVWCDHGQRHVSSTHCTCSSRR